MIALNGIMGEYYKNRNKDEETIPIKKFLYVKEKKNNSTQVDTYRDKYDKEKRTIINNIVGIKNQYGILQININKGLKSSGFDDDFLYKKFHQYLLDGTKGWLFTEKSIFEKKFNNLIDSMDPPFSYYCNIKTTDTIIRNKYSDLNEKSRHDIIKRLDEDCKASSFSKEGIKSKIDTIYKELEKEKEQKTEKAKKEAENLVVSIQNLRERQYKDIETFSSDLKIFLKNEGYENLFQYIIDTKNDFHNLNDYINYVITWIENGYPKLDIKQQYNSNMTKDKIFNQAELEISGLVTGQSSDIQSLNTKITDILTNNNVDIQDRDNKIYAYLKYHTYISKLGNKAPEYKVLTYAIMCGIKIETHEDLKSFIGTVQGIPGKYSEQYKNFLNEIDQIYDEILTEVAMQSLTARYETAARVAENRRFYESDFIKFDNLHSDQQDQSGLYVASNIRNINTKLDNYGRKPEGDKDEKNPAIMYTAFDITFKNTFNINNPAVSKLAAQGVDLRDDLSRYRIYDQDNNFFDKDARDKYVTEKLIPIGLTPDEIGELGKAVEGLPNEVEKNYEVLSGNFYADQDSFEKISKIYALGEIIDNIKKLFASNETLSNNNKLSNFMGLKLDENKPADIVGDCLLLKGTINGSETNIKYNLRTGKLYMNSFTQESINPPKITIGNTEPDTEIGNLGDFDDLLKGYEPRASLEIEENHSSNNSQYGVDMNDSNNPENPDSNDTDSNQKAMEKLMENKLFGKLSEMGRIVQEKAGEQSRENDVIIKILKTFNILPDDGKLVRSIEFEGGSNLFTLLESIKNTNSETELDEFSVLVNKLMKYCRLSRGNNNLNPATPDSSFVSISDINEEKTTPEIHSLIEANKAFFSENGEKDRIKNYESHFDDSVKLSFADIIFNNFCYKEASGSHKISVVKATNFVNSIENGIKNMKNDEQDIVALEETLDSLYD